MAIGRPNPGFRRPGGAIRRGSAPCVRHGGHLRRRCGVFSPKMATVILRPLIIVEETALRKLLLEAVFLGRQERTYRRRKSAEGKSQQYDTIFRVSRSSGRVSVEETDRQSFPVTGYCNPRQRYLDCTCPWTVICRAGQLNQVSDKQKRYVRGSDGSRWGFNADGSPSWLLCSHSW